MLGQIENLGRTEAEAQEVIEKEVVEFVGTYEVFGLLCDVAVFIGRDELGRNRGFDDVEQGCFRCLIHTGEGNPLDEVLDQCLGNGAVDAIIGHVVGIVGAPSEGQFGEVACADDEAVALVGYIHENLGTLSGLTVLISHIVVVGVVTDVFEMLDASIFDADFLDGDIKRLHQRDGICVGTVCRTETRHCDTDDLFAWASEQVHRLDTYEQGES